MSARVAAGIASTLVLAALGVAAAADEPAGTAADAATNAATDAGTDGAAGAPGPPRPAGWKRWFDPATAPFIPIPEIDTAPGSGTTLGVIPTVLSTDEHGTLTRIVAPDVIHSQYFGWGSRFRMFAYPEPDTQWSVVGGLKERTEREFDGRYATTETRIDNLALTVEAVYDRSGIPRFFGIGNDTPYSNQTSYLANQAFLDVAPSLRLGKGWEVGFDERVRYFDVLPGVLPQVPSIQTLFPTVPGLGSNHEAQQRISVSRDTRDSVSIPQSGGHFELYGGFVSRALASSVSYTFLGAGAQHYWSIGSGNTLAWHAALRVMPSAAGAPFWALSSLGGDRSVTDEREPLRSAVTDRYFDRNLFATGAELRHTLTGFQAFGTHVALEVAPFVDTGHVYSSMGTNPVSHLHAAGGLGVRGVASPYVVGYVDIGFGQDGASVFSGINYPF